MSRATLRGVHYVVCFASRSGIGTSFSRKLVYSNDPSIDNWFDQADIDRLLESQNRLVDSGHSVVVIEHNLDVIKTADYVIDLGPEGGHKGGELLACGTPEEIADCDRSYTGRFLAECL